MENKLQNCTPVQHPMETSIMENKLQNCTAVQHPRAVVADLAKARVMLQKTEMKKSGHNEHHGFNYYQLSDFQTKLNEICLEVGILPVFNLVKDKATLTIISSKDDSEQVFEVSTDIEWSEGRMGNDKRSTGMQPIQRLGSVQTYLRRYLFLAAFEIAEPDTIDPQEQGQPPVEPELTAEQRQMQLHKQALKHLTNLAKQFAYANGIPDYKTVTTVMYGISKESTFEEVNDAITKIDGLLANKVMEQEQQTEQPEQQQQQGKYTSANF